MASYTKRSHINLGFIRLNFTKHTPIPLLGWKLSSCSLHGGPWTWNSATGKNTIDVPGIGGHYDL